MLFRSVLLSGDDSLNAHSLNLSLRHLRLSSSNASPRAQEHSADARRAGGDEASVETEREVYSHERAIGPPAQGTAAADRQPWQISAQQADNGQAASQVSLKTLRSALIMLRYYQGTLHCAAERTISLRGCKLRFSKGAMECCWSCSAAVLVLQSQCCTLHALTLHVHCSIYAGAAISSSWSNSSAAGTAHKSDRQLFAARHHNARPVHYLQPIRRCSAGQGDLRPQH